MKIAPPEFRIKICRISIELPLEAEVAVVEGRLSELTFFLPQTDTTIPSSARNGERIHKLAIIIPPMGTLPATETYQKT